MLQRVLEPEVMDTAEEARDYDAMDHAQVNRVFVTDFLAAWHGRGPVLDLGTGTAQIPIQFCRQSPAGDVVAVDAAAHMLELAGENVRRAGFESRITLQLVDAKRMGFAAGSFLAVMSNSIVHHIPDPRAVFAEIARVAAPGATIFVRDLLRPSDLASLDHLVRTYAGGANAHQQKMFAESLHAALTLAEVRELVAAVGYDPAAVTQTTDRHWTWAVPRTR
ncbi:MAG TPA: class I SAM-dependent methyltransferase [Gemmataceae bacterium]|jgi:ubiquinone/menaquinone biosynthesis C-methylase UbiE|nr:class I SAM-dependent methyltransferase [Gemmataceae bacterium]